MIETGSKKIFRLPIPVFLSTFFSIVIMIMICLAVATKSWGTLVPIGFMIFQLNFFLHIWYKQESKRQNKPEVEHE